MQVQRMLLKLRATLNDARIRSLGYEKFSGLPGGNEYGDRGTNGGANGHFSGAGAPRWQKGPYVRSRLYNMAQSKQARIFVVLLLLLIAALCISNPFVPPSQYPAPDPSKPRHLRLLLPASKADQNLCKTLVSAAILGYSSPTLINWEQTFSNSSLIFGGSHLAKIDGVLDNLKNLSEEHDHDLVLLVDGYDVWFQLRPNVLIERFFQLNKRANRRLNKRFGRAVAARNGIEQRVIFSAQKKCWPKTTNHPSCWAIPNSPLPRKIYGPKTDTDIKNPLNPYEKYRPQYLNSGSVLGTVADVRRVFERAAHIKRKDKMIGSDQGIFGTIFGEQEFHRRWVRMQSRTYFRQFLDFFLKASGKDYTYRLIDPGRRGTHEFVELDPDESYEFGIGLDYDGRLIQPTVFSEDDTAWLQYDDKPEIKRVSDDKNVTGTPRIHKLPADIRTSLAPFYTLGDKMSDDATLPQDKSWRQVPLLTNLWTGISPVAVHHNAHHDGLKERIKTHWDKTWFFPHSRELLTERLLTFQPHLAVTTGSGAEQSWVSPEADKSKHEWSRVRTDTNDSIRLDDLCQGTWGELFRDSKGDWHIPTREHAVVPSEHDGADHDDDAEEDDEDRAGEEESEDYDDENDDAGSS